MKQICIVGLQAKKGQALMQDKVIQDMCNTYQIKTVHIQTNKQTEYQFNCSLLKSTIHYLLQDNYYPVVIGDKPMSIGSISAAKQYQQSVKVCGIDTQLKSLDALYRTDQINQNRFNCLNLQSDLQYIGTKEKQLIQELGITQLCNLDSEVSQKMYNDYNGQSPVWISLNSDSFNSYQLINILDCVLPNSIGIDISQECGLEQQISTFRDILSLVLVNKTVPKLIRSDGVIDMNCESDSSF